MGYILLLIFVFIFIFTGTREVSRGRTVFKAIGELLNEDDVKPYAILSGLTIGFFGMLATVLILIFS